MVATAPFDFNLEPSKFDVGIPNFEPSTFETLSGVELDLLAFETDLDEPSDLVFELPVVEPSLASAKSSFTSRGKTAGDARRLKAREGEAGEGEAGEGEAGEGGA